LHGSVAYGIQASRLMFPDISEHNGLVDWGAVEAGFRAGTIEAVAMRAGFGTVRTDGQFSRNQSECRARGIPAIYYWFCYPAYNSPTAEASMFNSVVGTLQRGEAMAGDFEDDPQARPFPRGQPGLDWAREFLMLLHAPRNASWWYTYPSLLAEVGLGPLIQTWPFWIADYGAAPDSSFNSSIARQFTDCGSTPGVTGCCDQSRVLRPPLSQWLTGGSAQLPFLFGGFHMNPAFRPGDPNLRCDMVYVGNDGHLRHRWNSGGLTGVLADNAGEEDLSAGLQFVPLSGSCVWDPQGANLNVTALGLDGVIYGRFLDINGVGPGWFHASAARAAVGQPGPQGPPGPNTDAELRAALKAAVGPLR
jgi:hypothetical protein